MDSLSIDIKEILHLLEFFRGRLAFNQNLTLTSGICIPASCTTKDVENFSELVFSKSHLNVISVSCESKQLLTFRFRGIAIIIFAVILLAVVASTIYELHMSRGDSEYENLMIL